MDERTNIQLAEALQKAKWGTEEYDAICEEICRRDDMAEKRGRASRLVAGWLNPMRP